MTADTFGKAKEELDGVNCDIHILTGEKHDVQKEEYVKKLGAETVVAFGNGNNDRKMRGPLFMFSMLAAWPGCGWMSPER